MAYNTKEVVKDVDGNPISQYYNPTLDTYEPVEGYHGANKVIVYDEDGNESDKLDIRPIISTLERLTGTVIDEETRKSNETTRKSNESSRVSVESDRVSAENTRVGNENTRKSNETSRETAETGRVNKEGERVTAESNRVSAESIRVSSENTRKSDENTRQSQETTRESNETLRIALYDDLLSKVATGFFKGEKGDTGNGLEFTWRDTELGVRVEGQSIYQYINLKGEDGDRGARGLPGLDGKNLDFVWSGTELGIRIQGESVYQYVDLRGPQGSPGQDGSDASVTKSNVTDALGFIPRDFATDKKIRIDENGNIKTKGDISKVSDIDINYLSFDGVSDYVDITDSSDSLSMEGKDEFTIQVWRYFDKDNVNKGSFLENMVSKEHQWWGSQPAEYVFNGGYHSTSASGHRQYIRLGLGHSVDKRISAQNSYWIKEEDLPCWNLYTGVYKKTGDDHTVSIYVHDDNGNLLVEDSNTTTGWAGISKSSYNLNLARSPRTGAAAVVDMRDVRIWDKALSEAEIIDNANDVKAPNDLIARWLFDEGTGNIVSDSVGFNGGDVISGTWKKGTFENKDFSNGVQYVTKDELKDLGGGTKIITSPTEPALSAGDQWHKEI